MDVHVTDLLPEYALGLLEGDEKARVERHLKGCALCQREAQQYQQTADYLPLAAASVEPPPALKEKIMERVSPRVIKERHTLWDRLGDFLLRPAVGWSLAALFALAFGISSLVWWRGTNRQVVVPVGPVESAPRVVALLATENAPQATGYLMVFQGDEYGTLVVRNLPPPGAGRAYQLWLVKDGTRSSGGVFTVTEGGYGTLLVEAAKPLNEYQSFGITVEPEGGSPDPTGIKVLGSGG